MRKLSAKLELPTNTMQSRDTTRTKMNGASLGNFTQNAASITRHFDSFFSVVSARWIGLLEVVGKARSDMLTHTLIDYLMGEEDGEPKDPNYIFRLYMALGNFSQAAKTAVIIAKQEQELATTRLRTMSFIDQGS